MLAPDAAVAAADEATAAAARAGDGDDAPLAAVVTLPRLVRDGAALHTGLLFPAPPGEQADARPGDGDAPLKDDALGRLALEGVLKPPPVLANPSDPEHAEVARPGDGDPTFNNNADDVAELCRRVRAGVV